MCDAAHSGGDPPRLSTFLPVRAPSCASMRMCVDPIKGEDLMGHMDELDLTETRDVSRPDTALRARINLNDP